MGVRVPAYRGPWVGRLRGAAVGGSVLVSGVSGPRCARSDEASWLSVWENDPRGWAGGWGHVPLSRTAKYYERESRQEVCVAGAEDPRTQWALL